MKFDRLDVLFAFVVADVFMNKLLVASPKEDFWGWLIFLLSMPIILWLWTFKFRDGDTVGCSSVVDMGRTPKTAPQSNEK